MILKKLLNNIPVIEFVGNIDKDIKDLAFSSNTVKEGSLFFAVRGYKTDGHKYIDDAIRRGAAAIVYDREDYKIDERATFVKVENTRVAMSSLSSAFYNNPSSKVDVIGITGTNGKTSTTYFIEQFLSTMDASTAVIGTNANRIADKVYKTKNTTPEAVDLHRMFGEMVDLGVSYCAMEVSSHAIYLDRVSDVNYKIGIFTNLSQDHLDFHPDMEDYFETKVKLFDMVNDYSVINVDDEYGLRLYNRLKEQGKNALSYGLDTNGDIMAKDINMSLTGSEFTLVTPDFEKRVKLNVPSRFMIHNALAAIGGIYYLRDRIDIPKAVEVLKNVAGRFDFVRNSKGKNIIIDYSHSPDALENILTNIRKLTNGRVITVFGCGGDRDSKKRPMMGSVAYKLSDHCILTNDNPRSEKPLNIAKDVMEGFGEDVAKFSVVLDRKQAIHAAINMTKGEDTVLIAGKGHETYQEVKGVRHDFDDKLIAKNYLKED